MCWQAVCARIPQVSEHLSLTFTCFPGWWPLRFWWLVLMYLFGWGSVLWGVLWGINRDLTPKLLISCKVSSVRRRQGVGPGQEASPDTKGSGGKTIDQAGIKQGMIIQDKIGGWTCLQHWLSSRSLYPLVKFRMIWKTWSLFLKWAPCMKPGAQAQCGLYVLQNFLPWWSLLVL